MSEVRPHSGRAGAPRTWHASLFTKYVLSFVGLVTVILVANGLVNAAITYRDAKATAIRLQAEKADAAAQRIDLFVAEIERQIGWTTHPQWALSSVEQRRFDFVRLLRQVPAITELFQIDGTGREVLRVSRISMDVVDAGTDYAKDPRFTEPARGRIWFSDVYYRKESEPYLTMSVARGGRNAGVTVAEVNLKLIWDAITSIRVGREGYAFVVDRRGRLVAHPDISLVLRNTDLSGLPQVADALADPGGRDRRDPAAVARDLSGQEVLAAYAPIPRLGWLVFVELPLREAYAPIVAALSQTAWLLLGALIFAGIAAWIMARRMTGPIRELEAGAARIGAGDLGHRISIRTGDELERLAGRFNRTASQLEESYASLEAKVEERTRELQESLEQQTATSEVLQVISRSPADLQPVLDSIVQTAGRLCHSDFTFVFRLAGDGLFHIAAWDKGEPGLVEFLKAHPIGSTGGSLTARVAREKRTIHLPDATADPDYRWPEFLELTGFHTLLSSPLLREGVVSGVIALARKKASPFSPKQIELVTTFADQAVIAIENARLVQELKSQTAALETSVEELRTLSEVGQAVGSTLDLARVLDTIAAGAVKLARAKACVIFRYHRSGVFLLWRAAGLDERQVAAYGTLTIKAEETLMGEAVQRREPMQSDDLALRPSAPLRDASLGAGFRAALILPLVRANRIYGTLVVLRDGPGAFPPSTTDTLQTFAAQSVLAIQNARLFSEIEAKGRELEVASQHKSQFLANMSHELRTPMNAVLGFTEMMADGLYGPLPEKAVHALDRVQANGRHLLGLINDVLDLSKIEAGQLTMAREPYAWSQIAQSVVSGVESLASAKGLALTVEVAPGLPAGLGDERRLTQVLLNLTGNAIKFTDHGGVAIAARADGAHGFEVTVTDTGPGIAPEDQERIFVTFQQVDDSSTRRKGGTGLGLPISRSIVELHGGTLDVTSEPGHGSTFRIRVPMVAVELREAAE